MIHTHPARIPNTTEQQIGLLQTLQQVGLANEYPMFKGHHCLQAKPQFFSPHYFHPQVAAERVAV